MKISRRESMQLSAGALASFSGSQSHKRPQQTAPAGLAETQLRNISSLPLKPDGSAPEYTPQEAGTITGVLWRTKNQTPEIEFDYRRDEDQARRARHRQALRHADLPGPREAAAPLLCDAPAIAAPRRRAAS